MGGVVVGAASCGVRDRASIDVVAGGRYLESHVKALSLADSGH